MCGTIGDCGLIELAVTTALIIMVITVAYIISYHKGE